MSCTFLTYGNFFVDRWLILAVIILSINNWQFTLFVLWGFTCTPKSLKGSRPFWNLVMSSSWFSVKLSTSANTIWDFSLLASNSDHRQKRWNAVIRHLILNTLALQKSNKLSAKLKLRSQTPWHPGRNLKPCCVATICKAQLRYPITVTKRAHGGLRIPWP